MHMNKQVGVKNMRPFGFMAEIGKGRFLSLEERARELRQRENVARDLKRGIKKAQQ